MKINLSSRIFRILVGIGAPVLLLGGAVILYVIEKGPPCIFYSLTGIYCPGCGAGRATLALMHFDVLGALDYNAFYVLILPIIAYYLAKIYVAYVFGRDILPFFKVKTFQAVVLLILICLFWLLRNIPIFPLTYLAP